MKNNTIPRRQRGSIIILGALAISIGVILLALADIGFMYYYQREYQKAADLAAMAGAKSLVDANGIRDCDNAQPIAQSNAGTNLGTRGALTGFECGKWNATTKFVSANSELNAVRTVVSGQPPHFLRPATTLTARATAVAGDALARLTIRSTLATVNTEQSPLLNGIVGGMLGGNINLPVGAWNGLLNTDINLLTFMDALAVHTGIGVGNYDQVLNAPIAVGELLDIAADVLPNGTHPDVSAGLNQLALVPGLDLPIVTLGSLLGVNSSTPSSALDVPLNVFELVQAGIQLSNGNNVADVHLPASIPGVGAITLKTKVIEPQQPSSIGDPALAAAAAANSPLDLSDPDMIYVRTAQAKVLIDVDLKELEGTLAGVTTLLNSLPLTSPMMTALMGFLNDEGDDILGIPVLDSVLGLTGSLLQGLIQSLSNAVVNLVGFVLATPIEVCGGSQPGCNVAKAAVMYTELGKFQVGVSAGQAEAWTTGFSCSANNTINANIKPALAEVGIGTIPENVFFATGLSPTVAPAQLLDIGYRTARPVACTSKCTKTVLNLGLVCTERKDDCGTTREYEQTDGTWSNNVATAKKRTLIGVRLKVGDNGSNRFSLGQVTPAPLTFTDPPGVSEPLSDDDFQSVSASQTVASIGTALTAASVETYSDLGGTLLGGILGSVITGVPAILNSVITPLTTIIANILAPLLDGLVNSLLHLLGINLANAELAGQLDCDGGGATLVD